MRGCTDTGQEDNFGSLIQFDVRVTLVIYVVLVVIEADVGSRSNRREADGLLLAHSSHCIHFTRVRYQREFVHLKE